MLFTEAQERFKEYLIFREKSKETVKGYMKDLRKLNRFLEDLNNGPVYLDDIEMEHIEKYMLYLKEIGLKPRSRNRYLFSVRSFLNYAVKKKWVDYNVASEIESVNVLQEKKVALTPEEIQQLLEAIEHPIIEFAVILLAYTGLRIQEAHNLRLEDIDFERNRILANGKGKKQRYIPIANALKPYLEDYLANVRGPVDSEYVLATKKTGRLSPGFVNYELRKAVHKLGWNKTVTCHTLRRSFATNLLRKGVNIFTISKLLGHASVKTTMVYLQLNEDELQAAVNKL
jgi:site-specific recombinase XerD